MPRMDLLALSDDDLASLTNRGTVKRARRELDSGTVKCDIDDSETLTVRWSDEVTCVFPKGKTIHDATCSSGGLGISRYVVRSVFAYQAWREDNVAPSEQEEESDVHLDVRSWDPGSISDDQLRSHFRGAAVTRAKKWFEAGVLVELTRGNKPTARFLHQSCTIRFPVPDDVRYVRGDCADSALAQWTCLAVWSFRQLPKDRKAGLLSLGNPTISVPREELKTLEPLVREWLVEGLANLPATWPSRWNRSEATLRKSGLVWPAELVCDIDQQHTAYREGDARFSPEATLRGLGELIARSRAIMNPRETLPQALVRGNVADVSTKLRGGRMIGLGLEIQPSKTHQVLVAHFQDNESGATAVIRRTITQKEDEAPAAFERLTLHSLTRGVSIGAASMSQLMVAGGKRSPTDELILPRGANRLSVHPQSFQWEHLLPPLLLDDFLACRQRFESLPPEVLRPRRLTENVHAFSIRGIRDVTFDPLTQSLTAHVEDVSGNVALLESPYYSRGEKTFSAFYRTLLQSGSSAIFISGRVAIRGGELMIHPLAVVIETGGERFATSPCLITKNEKEATGDALLSGDESHPNPIHDFFSDLRAELAEILVVGLRDIEGRSITELHRRSIHLGFLNLSEHLGVLAEQLGQRQSVRRWKADSAAKACRELCLHVCVADTLGC